MRDDATLIQRRKDTMQPSRQTVQGYICCAALLPSISPYIYTHTHRYIHMSTRLPMVRINDAQEFRFCDYILYVLSVYPL